MKYLKALAIVGCLVALCSGPVLAQVTDTFSFDDPALLGQASPPDPYLAVWSDGGTALGLFAPYSDSTQFGFAEAPAIPANSPISGQLLWGGKADFEPGGEFGESVLASVIFSGNPLTCVSFDYIIGGFMLDTAGGGIPTNEPLSVYLGYGLDVELAGTFVGTNNGSDWYQGSTGLLSVGHSFNTMFLVGGTPNSSYVEFGIDNLNICQVPEPGTLAFLLGGLAPVVIRLRRKR